MLNSLPPATLEHRADSWREEPACNSDLEQALNAVADAVLILNDVGTITFANAAAERILGVARAELVGSAWSERRWKTALADGRAILSDQKAPPAAELAGPGTQADRIIHRPDGTPLLVRCSVVLEHDQSGCVTAIIVTLADVSRQVQVEARLRDVQKIEEVGLLASGIAHDLNNYLTTILGNVCLIRDQLPQDEPGRRLLTDCEKAGWQAADLIKQLLSLARRKPPQFRPIDLRQVVHDTVNIFQRTLPPTIALDEISDPAAWPVIADSGQVGQVVLNLCTNARDAMPMGGRLAVEITNATAGRGPFGASREFVRLSVSDTGQGIGAEVKARMFEPFFTTKPNGKGTGLGLSVVFDIMQAHGGWVDCVSEVGTGTRLDVYFPRWRPALSNSQTN